MARVDAAIAREQIQQAQGEGGNGNPAWTAVAAALEWQCGIYRDVGAWVEENAGIPNVLAPIYDYYCPLVPTAPTEPPNWPPGGQCPDTTYIVNGVATNSESGAGLSWEVFGQGPILGWGSYTDSAGTRVTGIRFTSSTYINNIGPVYTGFANDDTYRSWEVAITSIRTDPPGLPDDCGRTPPTQPPRPPNRDVNRDPTFAPTFAPDFRFDVAVGPIVVTPGLQISPSLNVQVGPFDIGFDLGGVDINFNIPIGAPGGQLPPGGGGSTPVPPRPPNPPTPPRGGGGGGECPDPCPELDLSEVLELLEDIKECACEPERETLTESLSGNSGSFFTDPGYRIDAVFLQLTNINEGVRSQFGNGDSPDVIFAGWHAFGGPGGFGERTPISYQFNQYIPTGDYSAFSYCVVNNLSANVSIIYSRPR